MKLKMALITSDDAIQADSKLIGIRESESKGQTFFALWMDSAYIALTKRMKEELNTLKIKNIAPQLVDINELKLDTDEVSLIEALDKMDVTLRANSGGFPIIDVTPKDEDRTSGEIIALAIILNENERIEKVFVEDFVKMRYYRVNDAEQNKIYMLLEHDTTNDHVLCEIITSVNGACTTSICVSNAGVSKLDGSQFKPRKEGSNIRLRVDYLTPKPTARWEKPGAEGTVQEKDTPEAVDASVLKETFSKKKPGQHNKKPTALVKKFSSSHISKNGGKSKNYGAGKDKGDKRAPMSTAVATV